MKDHKKTIYIVCLCFVFKMKIDWDVIKWKKEAMVFSYCFQISACYLNGKLIFQSIIFNSSLFHVYNDI